MVEKFKTDSELCRACNPDCKDDCGECEKEYLKAKKEGLI
jgi:hypothetical protein